jgi:Flp pilus assembly pilin Flp
MLAEFVSRLLREDEGQDLIEYGILTGMVITIGIVIFTTISTKMGNAYDTWGTEIEDNWIPDQPQVPPPPSP